MKPAPRIKIINHRGPTRDEPEKWNLARATKWVEQKRRINTNLNAVQSAAGQLTSSISMEDQLPYLRDALQLLKRQVDGAIKACGTA